MTLSIRTLSDVTMPSRLAVVLSSAALITAGTGTACWAQVEAPYQNREEQQLYNPGSSGGSSILDATNPMDLINRIRQSGAMDDATPPSDAIDEALKAFKEEPSRTTPPSVQP